MSDLITQKKWDKAAKAFDFMNGAGPEKRWGPAKLELFSHMKGNILFLAVGTGLDFDTFPEGKTITGIDISPEMLKRAEHRAKAYKGDITLKQMDVHEMDFADESFDQVYTSCTFCSVPNPVEGLKQLHRVLKPGGEIRMFEHTGSKHFPFNVMMNIMTPLSSRLGPDMNRHTAENVAKAGFKVKEVENLFLDVVKTIYAVKE